MGRPISKGNIEALRSKRTKLLNIQKRIAGELIEVEKLLGHHSGNLCWSCSKRNGETTDLSMCELANPLYPDACNEFELRKQS